MKLCPRCECLQADDAFHWKSRARGERHSHCRACVNAKNRAAWHDNDRHGKKRRQEDRLAANAMIVAEAKRDAPCMDCGGVFPPVCMDFDHRDPDIKEFAIAQHRAGSPSRLKREIAKCDLVCANCHRLRTQRGVRRALQT